jgi:hypothetical protein
MFIFYFYRVSVNISIQSYGNNSWHVTVIYSYVENKSRWSAHANYLIVYNFVVVLDMYM